MAKPTFIIMVVFFMFSIQVEEMMSEMETREQVVLMDLERLAELDGHADWRETEARDLSALVQARLKSLQNPADCDSARKLVCNLNKGCGYGCQIHHAIYCFLVAYGTERTLILKSAGWRYNKKGFEEVFLPMSETCMDPGGGTRATWPGGDGTQVVELPIVDSVSPRPPYLPPAVPADLVDRIARLHGDPIVWWVSQFLLYMLRPQPHLTEMLDSTVENFKFDHPIVGVHIRRTDKVGTEAAFHPVEEYMVHVEEWFRKQRLSDPTIKSKVYIGEDSPTPLPSWLLILLLLCSLRRAPSAGRVSEEISRHRVSRRPRGGPDCRRQLQVGKFW